MDLKVSTGNWHGFLPIVLPCSRSLEEARSLEEPWQGVRSQRQGWGSVNPGKGYKDMELSFVVCLGTIL